MVYWTLTITIFMLQEELIYLILLKFSISITGASESDYVVDSEFLKLGVEADQSEAHDDSKSSDCVSSIGNITFVSCSTGPSSSPPSPAEEDKGLFFVCLKYVY